MSGKKPAGHPAASVGGQAVIEGVMMRGKRHWALACRRPDGTISLHSEALSPLADRHSFFKLPVARGIVALWESMALGIKALGMSANESMGEEEEDISGREMAVSLAIGIIMAVGLFVVLPLLAAGSVRSHFPNSATFVFAEGLLRIAILIIYIAVVSRIKQLRRVFEYHGAEHKTIHALEAGLELTPANVHKFSPVHPRCGTSFLLIVMVLAIAVFSFVPIPGDWTNLSHILLFILSRIIGIPLVVGLSYEVIKFAGKHKDNSFMKVVMSPGLLLQKLTTSEPDESQIEVAIQALEGVAALEPIELDHGGKADVEVMA
ncbi:MAG: DUF1385 domain-containing protein [Thermoleophilia bacterium]